MVEQKLSNIEIEKTFKLRHKLIKRNVISEFANKSLRRACHKDYRKLNTKTRRIYENMRVYKYELVPNCTWRKVFKEVRMFYVPKRDEATLIPIIKKNCKPGSEIVSDEWKSYNNLGIVIKIYFDCIIYYPNKIY